MLLFSPQFAMAKVVRIEPKLIVQSGGLHEVVKAAAESLEGGEFEKFQQIIEALPENSQKLVVDRLKTQWFNNPDLDKDR